MMAILEPFQKDATTIRADDLRNLLIVSGTELELKHLLATVEMFDINWMAGMSVGFFQLQSVDVKKLMTELDAVFGKEARAEAIVFEPDLKKLDLSARDFVTLESLRAKDSGRIVGPKAAKLGELNVELAKK